MPNASPKYDMKLKLFKPLSLTLFCLISVKLNGCLPPSPEIRGEVKAQQINDTLLINYDVVPIPHNHKIDSIFFLLPELDTAKNNDSIIYSTTRDISVVHKNRSVSLLNHEPKLNGRLKYILPQNSNANIYAFRMVASKGFWAYRLYKDGSIYDKYDFKLPPSWGMVFGIGLAFPDHSTFPKYAQPAIGDIAMDLELGALAYKGNFTGKASLDGQLIDSGFVSYTRSLGLFFYPGGRNKLWPSVFLDIKYSKIKSEENNLLYKSSGFGHKIGVSFESKFQRLAYSYNTNLGGYHQADLLLSFASRERGKIGTMYSFCHGEKLRMFRMRLYIEGATSREKSPMFYRRDSFIQNILAAGPLAPFYVLRKIIKTVI